MRKLISVIFNLFLTSSVVAQTCPDQNLFYTTQEEVDNFPVQYPDCTDLTHDFALFGANITDLSPLGKIKNVSTFLSLTELEGDIGISEFLNQFDTIGLTLFIEGIRSSESIVVEDLDYLGGLVFRNSRFVETFSVSTDSMGESFFISLENNRELLNLSFTASQDTLKAEEVRVLDNEMLTTLTLLGDVRTVTGDLLIEDSSDLDRITGLETLESVGGILSIQNLSLASVDWDFSNLRHVGSDLRLDFLRSIGDFSTFDNVETVGGNMRISNGAAIVTEISGFRGLTSVGEGFSIRSSNVAARISGFSELVEVGGQFLFSNLGGLREIDGFRKLQTVGEDLWLNGTDDLLSLESFSALKDVAEIRLDDCRKLVSLDGLHNVDVDKLDRLQLTDSDMLTICNQPNICRYINEELGEAVITNNGPDCSSEEEIKISCLSSAVGDVVGLENIVVYPNPATDILTVSIEPSATVDVVLRDMMGRERMREENVSVAASLELSQLPTGIYVLTVHGDGGAFTAYQVVKK